MNILNINYQSIIFLSQFGRYKFCWYNLGVDRHKNYCKTALFAVGGGAVEEYLGWLLGEKMSSKEFLIEPKNVDWVSLR